MLLRSRPARVSRSGFPPAGGSRTRSRALLEACRRLELSVVAPALPRQSDFIIPWKPGWVHEAAQSGAALESGVSVATTVLQARLVLQKSRVQQWEDRSEHVTVLVERGLALDSRGGEIQLEAASRVTLPALIARMPIDLGRIVDRSDAWLGHGAAKTNRLGAPEGATPRQGQKRGPQRTNRLFPETALEQATWE